MLNVSREYTGLKKWSSSQTREFGDLHALIATLVLACDTRWGGKATKNKMTINMNECSSD